MSLEDDLKAAAEAEESALEAKAFYDFFAKPENRRLSCIANEKLIENYIRPLPITAENIAFALENPELRSRLAVKSEHRLATEDQKERDALLSEIFANQSGSPQKRDYEKRQFAKMPTEQLRQLAEQKRQDQALKAMPLDELRRKVAALRPSPDGHELPEQYDRKSLLALPGAELRSLIKFYGSEMVDRAFARN